MFVMKILVAASCLGIVGSVSAAPAPTNTSTLTNASTCPMPVARSDTTVVAPMPVDRANTAVPMPTQKPGCTNPLFVRR